jgi:DNA-binding PadR family transcriptional regulator
MKSKLSPSVRERNIRAYLDVVILELLARRPMSEYQINNALTKEFHILIGPTTIYSKLNTLEKQKLITCHTGRSGKVYKLSEQGCQIIGEMPCLVEEICSSVKTMLSARTVRRIE